MPEPQAGTSFTPRMSALIVALMLAMVAVLAGITLQCPHPATYRRST